MLFCHVEPGTYRDGEIIFHPRHEEGIVVALDRVVSFADEYGIPMPFAMTPTSLRLWETDFDGREVGVQLHPQDLAVQQALKGAIAFPSDCLAKYPAQDQPILIKTASEIFEDAGGQANPGPGGRNAVPI